MDTAVQAVFDTFELLEMILLNLPLKEIFVHQRVSRAWLAVCSRSASLHRRMFLVADGMPLKPSRTHQDLDRDKMSPTYDTRYIRFNPAPTFNRTGDRYHRWACYGCFGESTPRSFTRYEMYHWETHLSIDTDVLRFFNGEFFSSEIARGSHSTNSSWRRMLITQPPITAITFGHFGLPGYNIGNKGRVCTIWNPAGITFGELYDWWWKFADEEKALRGERLDCRCGGMRFCLVVPFLDKEIDEVLRTCDPGAREDGLCDCLQLMIQEASR